jgi:hypothetical protein
VGRPGGRSRIPDAVAAPAVGRVGAWRHQHNRSLASGATRCAGKLHIRVVTSQWPSCIARGRPSAACRFVAQEVPQGSECLGSPGREPVWSETLFEVVTLHNRDYRVLHREPEGRLRVSHRVLIVAWWVAADAGLRPSAGPLDFPAHRPVIASGTSGVVASTRACPRARGRANVLTRSCRPASPEAAEVRQAAGKCFEKRGELSRERGPHRQVGKLFSGEEACGHDGRV